MAESTGPVIIKGPVDKLHFRSLVGVEQLSQPFRYDVEFLHDEAKLVAKQFLGEPLTVTLDVRENGKRHFNGVVTDFSLRGSVGEKTLYAVTMRPWLWLLTQRINSKIHSGTVPQIVKAICDGYMYAVVLESLLEHRVLSARRQPQQSARSHRALRSARIAGPRRFRHEGLRFYGIPGAASGGCPSRSPPRTRRVRGISFPGGLRGPGSRSGVCSATARGAPGRW